MKAYIQAIGAVTAAGLSIAEIAANARCGINVTAESDIYNQAGQPMKLALLADEYLPHVDFSVPGGARLTPRWKRMLALAQLAHADLTAKIALPQPVPLFLSVPEPDPVTRQPIVTAQFVTLLSELCDMPLCLQSSQLFPFGRAGVFAALKRAMQCLDEQEAVLIGGIDSFFDLKCLAQLDAEGRVLAEGVTDGFVPGEGACFMLLTRMAKPLLEPAGKGYGAKYLVVQLPGLSAEAGHRYSEEPYRGDGLAKAIASGIENAITNEDENVQGNAEQACTKCQVRTVIAGFNGEHLMAKEWGVAYLRNRQAFAPDAGLFHPADCYGDSGAAAGALLLATGCMGLLKEYLPGPILCFASADGKGRGACLLQAENPAEPVAWPAAVAEPGRS